MEGDHFATTTLQVQVIIPIEREISHVTIKKIPYRFGGSPEYLIRLPSLHLKKIYPLENLLWRCSNSFHCAFTNANYQAHSYLEIAKKVIQSLNLWLWYIIKKEERHPQIANKWFPLLHFPSGTLAPISPVLFPLDIWNLPLLWQT